MPRPDPSVQISPHLNRWQSLGLLTAWSEIRTPYRAWALTWWDGRRSEWREAHVRAAIVAVHELEGMIAAHA